MQTQIHAAAGPKSGQTVQDEAIEVLRATSDGNLLDPRDLFLLQTTVNHGRQALSDAGRAHWDAIVADARQGRYVCPWFHDVEHLRQRHDGSVLWRDVVVEHYTHADIDAQRRDAQELGACCRLIERRGQDVTASAVIGLWRELDTGVGLDLRRWIVMWAVAQPEQGLMVHRLHGVSAQDIEEARRAAFELELTRRQCASSALRPLTVVTREDLSAALSAIDEDCRWDLRSRPGQNRLLVQEHYDLMRAHLSARIDQRLLPSRAQVRTQILAPAMHTAAHEASGADAQPQSMERQRG